MCVCVCGGFILAIIIQAYEDNYSYNKDRKLAITKRVQSLLIRIQSLGWEDPLEKGMAIHSSILVWEIPRVEEPGRLQSKGSERVGHDWATSTH